MATVNQNVNIVVTKSPKSVGIAIALAKLSLSYRPTAPNWRPLGWLYCRHWDKGQSDSINNV